MNQNRIVFDMPNDDYRKSDGISHSNLKEMARSAAHYHYKLTHPVETTEAMLIGTLTHTAIFEPDKLPGSYVVRPDGMDFRTKAGQAWRDAQTAPIISQGNHDAIAGICGSLRANPEVAAWLQDGRPEVSMWATHPHTGLLRKGRVDWMVNSAPIFLDAKTCENAADFERDGATRLYHQQAAYYMAIADANEIEVERFVFLACEKQPPYGVRLIEFDEEAIRLGEQVHEANLRKLAECLKSGEWPSYSPRAEVIRLPGWLRAEAELAELR